jgi:hypothetical protein
LSSRVSAPALQDFDELVTHHEVIEQVVVKSS